MLLGRKVHECYEEAKVTKRSKKKATIDRKTKKVVVIDSHSDRETEVPS